MKLRWEPFWRWSTTAAVLVLFGFALLSLHRAYFIYLGTPVRDLVVSIYLGRIDFYIEPARGWFLSVDQLPAHPASGWSAVNAKFYYNRSGKGAALVVPSWTPLIPVGPIAAALWVRWSRRRRSGETIRCLRCRYDRRGLDPKFPCPECGVIPA